jgi:hypothetical protein
MDAETFTDLALRVIAHEATDEERRALETALAEDPARREEFAQLKIAHDVLRTTAPMTEAVRATAPVLPGHRLNELRTAVRQHFGPELEKKPDAPFATWIPAFRWLFGGAGVATLAYALVIFCFANQEIEVGMYGSGMVRGPGDQPLTAGDLPGAKLLTFDQDAPFDKWQDAPLAWNERAKIWIDNDHDQLHVVHRQAHGEIMMETLPLAPNGEAQREQIQKAVEALK